MLRVNVCSDDDIDLAGNLVADADYWDGDDGSVDSITEESGKVMEPVLRDIIVWENSTIADARNYLTRGSFQMNTWPNTRQLNIFGSKVGGIFGAEALSRPQTPNDMLHVTGKYNIKLESGDDWISDNTKLYASVDNATVVGAMFAYQYGQGIPY